METDIKLLFGIFCHHIESSKPLDLEDTEFFEIGRGCCDLR